MSRTVRLSSKGQVTIPASAREERGLKQGTLLNVSVRDGALFLEPVPEPDALADMVTGWAADVEPVVDVDAYYQQHRGNSS